jgi:3-oxoacyl-[acyl-carrier-protein] synthase II
MKRVVITGIGPVSAIGIGREAFFDALRARRPGLAPIAAFEAGGLLGGELRAFNVADYLESQKNYLDRSSELAFAALSLALEDADLDPKGCPEAALLLGSAYGNLATMGLFFADFVQKGPRLVKPVLFPHTYSNTTISLLAMEYGLAGYHANYAAGTVSAACALAGAFDLIRQGRETLAFAGGFESLNPILHAGLKAGGLLAGADGAGGIVPGEGAGLLVLEERDRALARGARILGELAGAGLTGGGRIGEAMEAAWAQAGWEGIGPDLIVSHANGSPDLDRLEAAAIADFRGRHPGGRVESIKPLTGETFGGGGALQAMAALGAGAGRVLANSLDAGGQSVCLALTGAGA